MKRKLLKERLESGLKHKIEHVRVIPGGSGHPILQIILSNGKKYLVKKLRMDPERSEEYQRSFALNPRFLPKLECVIPDGGSEVFVVYEWIDGTPLRDLYRRNRVNYFRYNKKTAALLRDFHAGCVCDDPVRVTEAQVDELLAECPAGPEQKRIIRSYILNNLDVLNRRKKCIVHGDVHPNNIIVSNGRLSLIDFDDIKPGDPYMDLIYFANSIMPVSRKKKLSYYFIIQYYFDFSIPPNFWRIVNVYSLRKCISIIGADLQRGEPPRALNSLTAILEEHADMTEDIPDWFSRIDRALFGPEHSLRRRLHLRIRRLLSRL